MKSKPRILIVEDNPSWQDIYQEHLEDRGFEIVVVDRLVNAADALNRYFFHIAIVDIRLKDGDETNTDGLQVLHRIWELDEGTIALVVSGHFEPDMYDVFRTYQMFGLRATPKRTPDDALREYQETQFIRGPFLKNGEIEEVLKAIDEARYDAQRKITRQLWLASPFGLIGDLSAKEIQQHLRAGQMTELRPFLADLCRQLYPWLRGKQQVHEITEKGQTVAIGVQCWSRALGQPILVAFGRRDWLEGHQNGLLQQKFAPRGEVVDELTRISSPHFEGAIYRLRNVDFNTRFEMPASRRITKNRLSLG